MIVKLLIYLSIAVACAGLAILLAKPNGDDDYR